MFGPKNRTEVLHRGPKQPFWTKILDGSLGRIRGRKMDRRREQKEGKIRWANRRKDEVDGRTNEKNRWVDGRAND